MPQPEREPGVLPLDETLAGVAEAVAGFGATLSCFADHIRSEQLQEWDAQALEQTWHELCERYEHVKTGFAELAEAFEDAIDAADASAALQEPGASIPWEDVKAELGLS